MAIVGVMQMTTKIRIIADIDKDIFDEDLCGYYYQGNISILIGEIRMKKVRVTAEIDKDVFDELCSYPKDRVNILIAEDVHIYQKDDMCFNQKEEEL